ncbi:MAG: TM2 domain-containing protein [Oscillospiraceae bacterium]|nr:TM2 domain-containing protein [Oscillospiraceae bacterium]
MYCKNCGQPLAPNAAVCLNCGVAVGTGTSYCQNCGAQTVPGAVICTNCGVSVATTAAPVANGQQKSKLAAGLLGIFLGSLGVHNFYLGFTGKAVAQLLITLLTCGIGAIVTEIWGLVEGILILTGSINTDAKGVPLSD